MVKPLLASAALALCFGAGGFGATTEDASASVRRLANAYCAPWVYARTSASNTGPVLGQWYDRQTIAWDDNNPGHNKNGYIYGFIYGYINAYGWVPGGCAGP